VTVLALIACLPSSATDFYVATDGDDASPGTREKPFATLERARSAVRVLIADGLGEDVTVHVGGGVHVLSKPLVLAPKDSGTEKHAITWAGVDGEQAVISGGRRIDGWTKAANGRWMATVPAVKAGEWYFRQLTVNGKRAARARSAFVRLADAKRIGANKQLRYFLGPGKVKAWDRLTDVEAVTLGRWASVRRRIASVDVAAGRVVPADPANIDPHPAIRSGRGVSCFIENALEELDEPGEWYLERDTGLLHYQPRPGEDPEKAVVIAPVLERLVEVRAPRGAVVRNLRFRNLHFRHAGWTLPDRGYLGIQACHYVGGEVWKKLPRPVVEAAVVWTGATGCRIESCTFSRLGGSGLHLEERCAENVVAKSEFFDISGNGIMVGVQGWDPRERRAALVTRNNRVAGNEVRDCGVEFFGAVGIWAGLTQGTRIEGNHVYDLPYTGISVGWRWDPKPTPCKANVIENNHVHHVMRTLVDGGGIYTLGWQPGTVIRANRVHSLRRGPHAEHGGPIYGLYLDQGSKGFHIEDNEVHVPRPLRLNRCQKGWHTWTNNTFSRSRVRPIYDKGIRGQALSCYRSGGGFDVPHSPTLDAPAFTVEAWIKLHDVPENGNKDARRWVVGKNGNEWTDGHCGLVILGARAGGYLNIGGGRDNALGIWSKRQLLDAKAWHHLAMSYDGEMLKIYHNGALCASRKIGKARTLGRGAVRLGDRPDNRKGFALPGLLDEVRWYKRALSDKEIADRHRAPQEAAPEGCTGHWGFNSEKAQ
jgi:hypothetical protein